MDSLLFLSTFVTIDFVIVVANVNLYIVIVENVFVIKNLLSPVLLELYYYQQQKNLHST